MSIDNAIRSLAYAESPTLSGAVALIAKRRNDLEAAMRVRELQPSPVQSDAGTELRALSAIDTSHSVDRTA